MRPSIKTPELVSAVFWITVGLAVFVCPPIARLIATLDVFAEGAPGPDLG